MVEGSTHLNPNGCGLGLTVSKKYVEVLGGEIQVRSIYGTGTEMIFTILPYNFRHMLPVRQKSDQYESTILKNLLYDP